METQNYAKRFFISFGLFSITASAFAAEVAEKLDTTGNRYGNPVLYLSEISAAKAWLNVSKKKDENGKNPVIIDVRRVEEYLKGHPVGAYSIPFPHVTGSPTQANDSSNGYVGYDISVDADVGFLAVDGKDGTLPIEDFVAYVEKFFPDKNQPIYLLCATGHRSVQAANALAKYGHYTQVKNIWEGYTGQPKYAYTAAVPTIKAADGVQIPEGGVGELLVKQTQFVQLDLNHDGLFDDNDKDGWAYYQGLPTETKLNKKLVFNSSLYTSIKK